MADRACTRGPVMDICRSCYLNSGQDDFAEADAEKCQPDLTAVYPTNDNTPMKARLSTRCWALLGRLIALHSPWPNQTL